MSTSGFPSRGGANAPGIGFSDVRVRQPESGHTPPMLLGIEGSDETIWTNFPETLLGIREARVRPRACIRYLGTGLPWIMTTSDSQIEWVPDECTLPTAEHPLRVAEFERFFAESVTGVRRPARTRLELQMAAGAEPTARDLAARESACCSFFTFTFTPSATMRIEVPAARIDVLDALAARVVDATAR